MERRLTIEICTGPIDFTVAKTREKFNYVFPHPESKAMAFEATGQLK